MVARKRRLAYEENYEPRSVIRPKLDAAPEIDICLLPIDGISPTFDPNQALFLRVFFSK
jgi:hypothetical protein